MRIIKILILNAMWFIIPATLFGQSLSIPLPGFKSCVGTAISSGVFLDKPAWFIGWSADYSYIIKEKWILLGGIAYDQEHKTKAKEGEQMVVHTLSPNVAVGYAITSTFAAGIGLGKGLFDTDNPGQKMKYTSSGNLTIGLLASLTIYSKNHHGLDISGGLARGLITPETDVTIEFGYGYSF